MKKFIVCLALMMPLLLSAQSKKKDVVTEEIVFLQLIESSEMASSFKNTMVRAVTAAICEVYNPWTGECDIWMDPDDPLPSTQALKHQKERQQKTDAFEKLIKDKRFGDVTLKIGKESVKVSCAYARFNQSEQLANSVQRMQNFYSKLKPFINDGTEPLIKGNIGLGELQECVVNK